MGQYYATKKLLANLKDQAEDSVKKTVWNMFVNNSRRNTLHFTKQ